MSGETRKVAVNTAFNAIGGIAVQLLTVVTGIFVARYFGAEDFGRLTLAATITGYLTLVTEFGLSTIAIRIVARTGGPERYIWSYLLLRLSLSALVLLILAGVMVIVSFPVVTTWLVVAYAVSIPLQVLKLNWLFYAQQNMFIDNVLQVSEKVIYTACLFGLVLVMQDIIIVPVAMAISVLLMAALSWMLFLRSKKHPVVFTVDRGFIREMVVQGWPVGVAGAALRSNTNIDTLFVNAYHGDVATGLYGAAYRLINAMITAGTFFTNAVFPLSCKRHKESVSSLASFIEYSSKLLVLVVVPGLILLTVGSREIIGLIFGKEYAGAVLPFQILVWAAGIAIVCRLYHNTLVACERQHSFMKIILASVAVNLVCNVLLIPPFGIMGAAVATVLTEFFLLVLTFIALSRVLEMRILADVATIVVCAGFASATFLFSLPLVISMLLFAAAYFGLLLVLRIWGAREWRLVRMVLGRG